MNDWYTINKIDEDTYIISEYYHQEETHCYLIIGQERALIIDTGLGIGNIYDEVIRLTDKPVIAAATHVHWDHIGGHRYFPDFYVHNAEVSWLTERFPLPLEAVKHMVTEGCELPNEFDIDRYEIFSGIPTRILSDGDMIDLGGRTVEVIHTPGHSPGHMCFFEPTRGYLYSGDLVYRGTLFAHYPSTDPNAYLESLEKISLLSSARIFPGHHSLDIEPTIIMRIRDAFRQLQADGKLHHGGGSFEYDEFKIRI
ncbi:MAG: MBL fold metallo-hydrolase [Clostridiales bacterium]|nr:MBL fold metallo-hydrolase [Clostridiales bacterium]